MILNHQHQFKWRKLLLSASALATGVTVMQLNAVASAESDTIVVTAQKREQNLQEVPLSVSAYTDATLENIGVDNIQDLTNFSPSFRYEKGRNARDSFVSIRGLGSNGFNTGIDPSVGFYLDGVYLPRPGALLTQLADIQAVEVLKGPQGTLYGANTPAGVVNINTGKPSQEFEARLRGDAGNFGRRSVSGFVSGGITDTLSARATFWSYDDNGTSDLVDTARTELRAADRFDSRTEFGGRIKVLWEASDAIDVELAGDFSKSKVNCCALEWIHISDAALDQFDLFTTSLNLPEGIFPSRGGGYMGLGEKLDHISYSDGTDFENFKQWGASINVSADIFAEHTFDLIAAYREWDTEQNSGVDAVGINISAFNQPEVIKSVSVEARLASPTGQFLEYLTGAFFYRSETDFFQTSSLELPGCMFIPRTNGNVTDGLLTDDAEGRSLCLGNNRSDFYQQEALSAAIFADVTLNFTDNLSLIVGGRLTYDEKEAVKDVRLFNAESEARAQNFIDLGLRTSCPLCQFGDNGGGLITGNGFLFGTIDFAADINNTEPTWSATLRYLANDLFPAADNLMFYARAATGYKAPGINGRAVRTATTPTTFFEETSLSIEGGFRSNWFDNRLMFNLTYFWTEFDDLQQEAANPIPDDAGVFGRTVVNAGTLVNQGIEGEYSYTPNEWLEVFGAFTYLDSEFTDFGGAPCEATGLVADGGFGPVPLNPLTPPFCDQTGFAAPNTAKWRANNTVQVTLPFPGNEDLEWQLQGTAVYTGDITRAVDQDVRAFQEAYTLFNLSASLQSQNGDWRVTAYAENVTNKVYIQSTTDTFTSVLGFNGSLRGTLGTPRTYGIRGTVDF